jgi:hypothetical protein
VSFEVLQRIRHHGIPSQSDDFTQRSCLTAHFKQRDFYRFCQNTLALREEFAGIVRHMVERLSGAEDGKPKKFKNSMMEKMGEFLESFSNRNLFNDDLVAELARQVKDVVNGLSTDELRQDANLRKYIADEMNQLRAAVDGALEDLPRRKIRSAA